MIRPEAACGWDARASVVRVVRTDHLGEKGDGWWGWRSEGALRFLACNPQSYRHAANERQAGALDGGGEGGVRTANVKGVQSLDMGWSQKSGTYDSSTASQPPSKVLLRSRGCYSMPQYGCVGVVYR